MAAKLRHSATNLLSNPKPALAIMLLLSYGLRLLLIGSGGQMAHADEHRYYRAVQAAEHIFAGDFAAAADRLLRYGHHHAIPTLKLAPALFHRLVYGLSHADSLNWDGLLRIPTQMFWLPALIFALPSVLCIGMVYLILRRVGADAGEALLGALLMACCNAFFIFAQHLMPYDSAILVSLVVIWRALDPGEKRFTDSLWIGSLTFLVFWIYNGYITLSLTIGALYCLYVARDAREAFWRLAGMACGGAFVFLPVAAYNLIVHDQNIVELMYGFSNSISDGSYAEGVIFPFLYFRDVEGAMGLIWLGGLLGCGRLALHAPDDRRRRRARLWLLFALCLYLLLSLFSTGLRQFVLYGRVARSLAPFIVMACAVGYAPILSRYGWRLALPFVAGLCVLGLLNFLPATQLRYPLAIVHDVYEQYDDVSYESTVRKRFMRWDIKPALPDARYKLFNAAVYLEIFEIDEGRPEGELMLEAAHPLRYKPWQYEGLTPAMRDMVNGSDFAIWLIDAGSDG